MLVQNIRTNFLRKRFLLTPSSVHSRVGEPSDSVLLVNSGFWRAVGSVVSFWGEKKKKFFFQTFRLVLLLTFMVMYCTLSV